MALGLSGGGDSVALLLAAAPWAQAQGRALHALIVDHGLRDGAADDARFAAHAAESLGVTAHVLCWRGDKPATGLPAAARQARYGLMADAMRGIGADTLFLGHTADDQAETLLMHMRQGAGWRGCAGMRALASYPLWPEGRGLSVARPFLNITRRDLRMFLAAQNAVWREDPTNEDRQFERVRVRRRLARLKTAPRLTAMAETARRLVSAENAAARLLVARTVKLAPEGWAEIASEFFSSPAAPRAMSALLTAHGGGVGPARGSVKTLLQKAGEPGFRGATLGGARLSAWRGARILTRDPGALLGRGRAGKAMISLNMPAQVWDERFEIEAPFEGISIAALGEERAMLNETARVALQALPPPARAVQPALYRDGAVFAVPTLEPCEGISIRSRLVDRLHAMLAPKAPEP